MTATAEREYARLIAENVPRVIRTKRDYQRAMAEVTRLARLSDSRSVAQTEYYDLLSTLVAAYEREHISPLPQLSPRDFLKEAMDLRGISQKQISDALGDRAAASAILSGKRQISKAQAKRLAALFRVDAGLFI
jgi:HTH-type transcriptional regulator / antitoxin HigA